MAITTVPLHFIPNPPTEANNTLVTLTAFALNAAGDKMAFIIQVPKDGTLDWFEFRVGAIANAPDNGIRFSFQSIDATTGFPDGVVDQFAVKASPSANTWTTPDNVMTDTGAGGGTKRTVAAGEYLGCVIDYSTFVASDSFEVTTPNHATGPWSNNYTADGSTGTYAKATRPPMLALKYSDGTYAELPTPIFPMSAAGTATTFGNGSTPDERALRFQVPVSCRCVGAWFLADGDADADIVLYDNANNVLASASIDPDIRETTGVKHYFVWWDAQTLSAATTYRIAIKPTTASTLTVYQFTVASNGLLAAVPGGIEWYLSTRTDGGSFSDTTTIRPMIGLSINGYETGSAGGSGGSFVFIG
jgi:hypothetical protein